VANALFLKMVYSVILVFHIKSPVMLKKSIIFCTTLLLAFSAISADVADVSIKKFEYIPKQITIKKGTTVRWTNNEKRQYHNVWFKERSESEPDYFFPEETYQLEFNETGTFRYHCGPHPKMQGVVIVID